VFGIFIILWVAITSVKAVNTIDFRVFEFAQTGSGWVNGSGWIYLWNSGERNNTESTKEKDNTYILITGRWGGTHDAPDLTDTIILAGINFEDETLSMLSIPRDLWVDYPNSTVSGKINRIYETYVPDSPKLAIEKLKTKVTEITGKEIDFYVNLDFEWFIKVVDTLWGVEISLDQNFVDTAYPTVTWWYRTFILRKWTWTLDGEVALMYARSRHSTSDFDRSLRQQEIISSLRQKVSNLWYFRDSGKIIELYSIFTDYIDTDMSLAEMTSLWLDFRGMENLSSKSFNLNDTCYAGSDSCIAGWLLYVPLREYFYWASVLLPNQAIAANPSEYNEIKEFSSLIFDTPDVVSNEDIKIEIYNASWISGYAREVASSLIPYWILVDDDALNTLASSGTGWSVGSKIYYNSLDPSTNILDYLEKKLWFDIIQKQSPLYSEDSAQIEIILTWNN